MVNVIKKIVRTIVSEYRVRGLYFTIIMYVSYLIGVIRGLFYTLLYFKNVKSTLFFIQANSKIEIYNRRAKMHIGEFVFIRKNVSFRIDFEGELIIEEKVFINDNCNINCVKRIVIGRKTKIGPNVCINDHDHNYKNPEDSHLVTGEVIIGENVWIGSNVVILRNTIIGDNVVIAAGSVVKGNVPANTLFINKREIEVKHITA